MADGTLSVLKSCTKCQVIKPATAEFYSKSRKGLRAQCKSCVNAEERLRREAKPEAGRARGSAWYAANKERRQRASAEWYAANKVRVASNRMARIAADPEGAKKSWREWANQKYRDDPTYRINTCVSSHIRKCLKGDKGGRSWQALVGYSVDDLAAHLERQFLKGMTWANFGEWHIDHVVPKSAFSFQDADSPEFRACWALTNLRPLWAVDNIRKADKRVFLI